MGKSPKTAPVKIVCRRCTGVMRGGELAVYRPEGAYHPGCVFPITSATISRRCMVRHCPIAHPGQPAGLLPPGWLFMDSALRPMGEHEGEATVIRGIICPKHAEAFARFLGGL